MVVCILLPVSLVVSNNNIENETRFPSSFPLQVNIALEQAFVTILSSIKFNELPYVTDKSY
jgi:hypothetical protein